MLSDDPDPACSILAAASTIPESSGSPLFAKLLLLIFLVLLNAFFAMSEIAIISLNDSKIKKMAEDGHKGARKVLKLTDQSSAFLSTIQIGVTLAGFLTSASAATSFADKFGGWLTGLFGTFGQNHASFINGLAVVLITLLTSYFSLVFGELAPKRLAMQYPEKISFAVVGILLFIRTAMKPFIVVLTASTNLVIRLFGIDPHSDTDNVTEEEIRMMVDVGEEKGVIEESQKEMINNIFDFDDISIEEIMTHRTDIVAAEVTDTVNTVVQMAVGEGLSRIPVYEDDLDNIVGIVYVKDLLPLVGKKIPENSTVKQYMREAFFVPDSKKCGSLFTEMTEKHIQMAIVVDEYGGTAGLATMEDLIESILGNIQDEYDNEDEDIEQVSENIFTIDGTTDIEEVSEMLGRDIPEGDYDTLGGMIMYYLGRIPSPDEKATVEVANILFTVESLDERRIDKVRAELLPIPDTSDDDRDTKQQKPKDRDEKEKDRDKEKDKGKDRD